MSAPTRPWVPIFFLGWSLSSLLHTLGDGWVLTAFWVTSAVAWSLALWLDHREGRKS